MSERRTKVLLIEDDPEDAMIIRDLLQHGEGPEAAFEVEAADSLEAGLAALDRAHFDVALVDLMLPDSSGIETFQRLHERHPDLPAVILSGLRDERLALAAVADGAQDYLLKGGIDSRAFKRAVRYAVERRRLARRLEGVLEGSADGMVVIDAGGTVRYANPAALALFGREAGEMVGKPFGHPLPARQSLSLTLPDPSGGERAGEMRVTEIEWQGAPARLASIRDVTVLRRLEQLKAEIRERHKVDELKDHFLHCVSHELRSPLTIVKAAVANLRDGLLGELNEAQLKMIQMADRNVGRINKIVSNLLDLSRLESGRASMNMRRMDVTGILRDMAECFQVTPDGGRLDVEVAVETGLARIEADPDMLVQVFSNLLDNAARYARRRIRIEARSLTDETAARALGGQSPPGRAVPCIEVTVTDDGPGIDEGRVGEIFNKFVQINRPVGGAQYKGTGLGLAICREIVHRHGGRIWVDGRASGGRESLAGARFHVALPQMQPIAEGERGRGARDAAAPAGGGA